IPETYEAAIALFQKNPFEFERWAVSLVGGQPNEKQVGDRGVDGRARFPLSKRDRGHVLISVKGGAQINPGFVRDLIGTMQSERAQLGVLVCLTEPTSNMKQAAAKAGSYTWPVTGERYPRCQIVTIKQLLEGRRPALPSLM